MTPTIPIPEPRPITTRVRIKKLEGDLNFQTVTYEACASQPGRDGLYVTTDIAIRVCGQECEATVDFGPRKRASVEQCLDSIAEQFEMMAKALKNRKPAATSFPTFE